MTDELGRKEVSANGPLEAAIKVSADALCPEEFLSRLIWPLGTVFAIGRGSVRRTALLSILLLGIPPLLIVDICSAENTLLMGNSRVGLLQHYGFMAFFVVHILIVPVFAHALRQFREAVRHIPRSLDTSELARPDLSRQIDSACKSFAKPKKWFLHTKKFALILGGLAVLCNAVTTLHPQQVYGHDVWDSSLHQGGYIAARIYLALTWGIILPIIINVVLYFCVALGAVYRKLGNVGTAGLLSVHPLNSDRAGGLKPVATAILAAALTVAPLGTFIITLIFVHGITLPLCLGAVGWVLLMCTMFFGSLYFVHCAMRRRRRQLLREIEAKYDAQHLLLRELINREGKLESKGLRSIVDNLERLRRAFQLLQGAPVWPFGYGRLVRFLGAVVPQVLLIVLGSVLKSP
jgi:hypothetical protein